MSIRAIMRRIAAVLAAGVVVLAMAQPARAVPYRGGIELEPEEREFISAHNPFRVGFVQDSVPVSFTAEDGNLAGITRYILDRMEELTGIEFEYVPLPAGAVTYEYLSENDLDLVTSVEYNKENLAARGILTSEPYFSSRKVIVARENLDFKFDAHLTVAISSGSQTIKKVLAGTYPNFEIKEYDSIPDCFEAVKTGEADLLIQNQFVVEYWISKPAYERLKAIPMMGLDDLQCFSAIVDLGGAGTSTEDGKLIIEILNKAIASISEDEESTFIIRGVMENQYKYELKDFLYRYRYAVGIFIFSVLVITLLVILLWRQRVRSIKASADAKAKGQFLSAMSHEIRTPLNGLIGLNYLMSQKLDDPQQLTGYLRQSSNTAQYLLSLVSDILDMSELEEKKVKLDLRPVDLPELIGDVCSAVGSGMREKNIEFCTDTDIHYPHILGDGLRIRQIMMNLLDNARKFTPEGGRVMLSVEQSTATNGEVTTRVNVADNGRGISEEFQKHLFDAFAQERESVSKGNQGTGLGLPISRKLARLMGGDLTFVSRKGEGSAFTFSFTSKLAEPENHEAEQKNEESAQRRVLVAEDNELNAEIMMELMEAEGYEADLAVNGREALRLFEESEIGTYDVILMDLLMPEMDGYEAARAIRGLRRPDAGSVRILACTANTFEEDRKKAFESGMDDFIPKPVDLGELRKKLADVEKRAEEQS